jgi:hypothetical protein
LAILQVATPDAFVVPVHVTDGPMWMVMLSPAAISPFPVTTFALKVTPFSLPSLALVEDSETVVLEVSFATVMLGGETELELEPA